MTREHWIPVGWSYPNEDVAQGELEALRSAGVRCELRETASGAFTPEDTAKPVILCIWVLFEQRELTEQILNQCKRNQIRSATVNLCEKCNHQPADVHLTIFDENGNQTQRNFCQDCYQS